MIYTETFRVMSPHIYSKYHIQFSKHTLWANMYIAAYNTFVYVQNYIAPVQANSSLVLQKYLLQSHCYTLLYIGTF